MTSIKLSPDDRIGLGALRNKYVESPRDAQVRSDIDVLLENRAINLCSHNPSSRMGLMLTAAPGAGKTALLTRLFARHAELQPAGEEDLRTLSLVVESPTTLKSLALQILRNLGMPVVGLATRADYWVDARFHLRANGIRVLWLDEAQHVFETASDRHSLEIISTLKNLMSDTKWPIVLVLSGPPDLSHYCVRDRQLARRLLQRQLDPINEAAHGTQVLRQLQEYCGLAGLLTSLPPDFIGRLLHATSGNLGMTFELIVDGIQEAMANGANKLELEHFATAYTRQNGLGAINIFLADDWLSVVVGAPSSDPPDPPGRKPKATGRKTGQRGAWGA